MVSIIIDEPIWWNKSIGIKRERITDALLIDISFIDSSGEKVYPSRYKISKEYALSHQDKTYRNGLTMVEIPIDNLTEIL
jgi:hypothetical protein